MLAVKFPEVPMSQPKGYVDTPYLQTTAALLQPFKQRSYTLMQLQTGQKVLIMYTDGGDSRSALNQKDVVDLLRASDVTVYVIGYLEHQGSAATAQRQLLDRFAVMTGGQAFFPVSLKEIDKMYEKIQHEIAARYSIGYTSTDERTNGAWRRVDIRLKRPDLKNVRLRTRDGYFAKFKEGS